MGAIWSLRKYVQPQTGSIRLRVGPKRRRPYPVARFKLCCNYNGTHSVTRIVMARFTFPTFIMAQSQLTLESMKFWDYRFDILIRPNEWAVGSQFCSGKKHFVQAIGPF